MNRGFSLVELLLALTITIGIGMVGFQLFRQNERGFHIQNVNSESQQNARSVAYRIAEEIRKAGQGTPVYASTFDSSPAEAVAFILDGSNSTHLRMRAGLSNIETAVVAVPADYTLDAISSIAVADSSLFSTTLSTTPPPGRFAYVWGSGDDACWGWIRGEILAIGAGTLTLTPRQAGEGCRTANTVRFTFKQTVALEEAVSVFLSAGSIWHTSATDMTNANGPSWGPSAELARNVTDLTFRYFAKDTPIPVDTLDRRASVTQIEVDLKLGGFALSFRSDLRNSGIR